jgi:hypothetical protein
MTIIASNLKLIGKNTLKATADIEVPQWRLKIRGCMWHLKNGAEWIAFPSREWVDQNNKRQFAVLLEFTDKEVERRFKGAALDAVHELAARRGQ